MSDLNEDRAELLVQAASMYFERGLNQAEISEQLQISRSSVSRLLAEARERGIVEIHINYPLTRDAALEQALAAQFSLQQAYVLHTRRVPPEQVLSRLGRLASLHLEPIITDTAIVGLSWGTAIFETVRAIRQRPLSGIKVVQVIGAVGRSNPLIDGPDLARQLADRLGGQYFYLHAPLLVESAAMRAMLLAERGIRDTLENARRAQIALVGIGSTDPQVSSLIRAGYLSRQELQELVDAGAVGDVCVRHFDITGAVLDIPLNERVVGIGVDDLLAIPHVVGVAAGVVKARAILGALRGAFVDVLVTDDRAAREVLRLAMDREGG